MKAAIYKGERTFSVEEIEQREIGIDDVRIDVMYCGICGTDRHIYHGMMDDRVKPPQIIGHEMSGIISEVGKNVKNILVGDKVVVRPLDSRNELPSDKGYSHICKNIKFIGIDTPGAMQQSWVVPAFTIHKLPQDINMQIAAIIEPLAVACHGIARSKLTKGETSVIIGGGSIGLLIGMVALQIGSQVILSEINEHRLSIAKEMGLIAINPTKVDIEKKVYAFTEGSGADVVFEVSGSSMGVQTMTNIAAIRARIIMVAIHSQPQAINLFHFFWKELEMLGTRVYEPKDYEEAINLVASEKLLLEPLITDVVSLNDTQKAFEALECNEKGMKILINCQN